MTEEELESIILELCQAVRKAARPHLGSTRARELAGRGASGDITFGIDGVAERVVEEFLEGQSEVASYTEDRGLVKPRGAEHLLVIDPIDGTRPAAAGLEACCVSVAAARLGGEPVESLKLGDVFMGAVQEIKNDAVFFARRSRGAVIQVEGEQVQPVLSSTSELERIFWTLGFRGRPAEPLVTVLAELIDASSVDGGVFDLGSAAFCMTRLLTGEMDAYVDVGQRMVEECAPVREMFIQLGHGSILNNYPYDVAACALIASECGASVTDAYGRPLDGYALVPPAGGGQLSAVACANRRLHARVMAALQRGMDRLTSRYHEGAL